MVSVIKFHKSKNEQEIKKIFCTATDILLMSVCTAIESHGERDGINLFFLLFNKLTCQQWTEINSSDVVLRWTCLNTEQLSI